MRVCRLVPSAKGSRPGRPSREPVPRKRDGDYAESCHRNECCPGIGLVESAGNESQQRAHQSGAERVHRLGCRRDGYGHYGPHEAHASEMKQSKSQSVQRLYHRKEQNRARQSRNAPTHDAGGGRENSGGTGAKPIKHGRTDQQKDEDLCQDRFGP